MPNFEEFIALFDQKGISYDRSAVQYYNLNGIDICERVGDDFIKIPLLREMIEREVERVNRDLETYEQIKKYVILNRRFTEKSGEMTPTLKVKRKVIISNHESEIKSLFS